MLLFNLVGPLKFGYACEMSPWVTGGLLLTSGEAYLGNRIRNAAEMCGGAIFGTLLGAFTVKLAAISRSWVFPLHSLLDGRWS